MRALLIAIVAMLGAATSAHAAVNVGVSIGIDMPAFPQLTLVPGYPVYYDPDADSNYFFYDGQYWVYDNDNWYASSWYNGPWQLIEPDYVPLFVLRVPVRYYRRPPAYFSGWRGDAPPRWGDHWGHDWEQHHSGWSKWDRHSAPHAAPVPVYQRQYSGDRYPRDPGQQQSLRSQNYHYQTHDAVTQRIQQQPRSNGVPAAARPRPQQPETVRQQPPHQQSQQSALQQRSTEPPRVQPNVQRQRPAATHPQPAAAEQPRQSGPPPGQSQRPPADAHGDARENPPASRDRGGEPGNKDREERGDDRH